MDVLAGVHVAPNSSGLPGISELDNIVGALLTLVIAGGLAAVFAPHDQVRTARSPYSGTSSTITSSTGATSWTPTAPATTVPVNTPVQQQYDDGFKTGFSSSSNREMFVRAESLELPLPAVGGGWPELHASATPESWTTEFASGLLNIDFARRSQGALAPWLVAEEAPDLMPGIPAAFQERALYVSLLETGITGQPSPLPGAIKWAAFARAGIRWATSDLQVQLDPQWQQMIDAGWQPCDIRSAVEDVSGVLHVVERTGTTTTRRFSMMVQVGSARWHDGYGTVLVSGWKEI